MSRDGRGSFTYREGLFTPAQAAACTGLSPAMQRNWRQAEHIAERKTEVALFSPRDLAAIRIMVVLRDVGLGPALSRPIAERAAPSVVWLALATYPETWTVSGNPEDAAAYRDLLDRNSDRHLREMAGLTASPALYGIAQGKTVHFFTTLDEAAFDEDDEVETVIKFSAVAKRIAKAATQPLMTVIAPAKP